MIPIDPEHLIGYLKMLKGREENAKKIAGNFPAGAAHGYETSAKLLQSLFPQYLKNHNHA